MFKKTLLSLLLIVSLPLSQVIAKTTPVESFINHVKENTAFAQVNSIWQPDANLDKTAMLKMVKQAQPLTIDYAQVATFMQQKNTAINLTIPGNNGKTYTLELARYDFLSNEFKVVVNAGANNTEQDYDYTPGLYYTGVVQGVPGSLVAFSFFNNEVFGIFSIPGEGNYVVAPNTMIGNNYDYNTHYILYNDADLLITDKAPKCGTDQLKNLTKALPAHKSTTDLNNNEYNTCRNVRVLELADYSMFVSEGSSVRNTANYLTSLFNNQAAVYRNEGILINLHYVTVDSVIDSYQTLADRSKAWLTPFSYNIHDHMHGADVAIMCATKYGDMGGVAWLQQLCQPYHDTDSAGPYAFTNVDNTPLIGFPTYSWDVEVTSHEMGHVLGSPHTHCCCWNPSGTGTTAIDGCYTLEGTCSIPSPALPAGGGTVMSYCHLTSDGINLSNGFGPQPGDTIRYYNRHMTCGINYNPFVAPAITNHMVTANRECTDLVTGITYYFKDNNTAKTGDDTLVLMINKNGNNIGGIDTAGFKVMSGTIAGYGTGSGEVVTFPVHTPGVMRNSVAMRRYWKINNTVQPLTPVEVIFPFTAADTADINGSVDSSTPVMKYYMYKVNVPTDPNPSDSFTGATADSFTIYHYNNTVPTTYTWSYSIAGTSYLAHMMMLNLKGGGGGFYTYDHSAGVKNVTNSNSLFAIYPNPTSSEWTIAVAASNGADISFNLYAADGRLVKTQLLKSGTLNTVDASMLPAGIYLYRIGNNDKIYNGSLLKK